MSQKKIKTKRKKMKNEKANAMRSPNVTDGCTEYEMNVATKSEN